MRIYILDISKFDKTKLLPFYGTGSEYRRKKFDSKKNPDEKFCILGNSFLISYVASIYDIPYETLAFTENGKPFFENSPLFISLSHKNNICALAISDAPIGIDVELKKEQPLYISNRFFSEKERLILENSTDKNLTFTEIWTRKESLFKAASPETYTLSELCTTERFTEYNGKSFEFLTFWQDDFAFSVCKTGKIEKTEKFILCL